MMESKSEGTCSAAVFSRSPSVRAGGFLCGRGTWSRRVGKKRVAAADLDEYGGVGLGIMGEVEQAS